jgi:hypothetical protein
VNTVTNLPVASGSVTFKIGDSIVGTAALNGSGVATLNLRLFESSTLAKADVAPGAHTVTAIYSGSAAPCYAPSSNTNTLNITREDARTMYTGVLFTSTSCATCSTATVTLSATVQDITAIDPSGDPNNGDIRNATVTFVNRDTNTPIATVPIGLVSAADLKTGTVTYNWSVDIGNADSNQYTVGVVIDGYYVRNSSAENTVVTVSKPIASNFITGGGYLTLARSGGIASGDPATKNNFGFNVKFNKSGTNLMGNINVILRRTESDNVLHTYQIKGNALTQLSVNTAKGTATFNGKANIQDITDPAAPVSVDGNATLQVTMTDKGDGPTDTIGVTLWNKSGGMWFSSNWSGTATLEQTLGGGNLAVH